MRLVRLATVAGRHLAGVPLVLSLASFLACAGPDSAPEPGYLASSHDHPSSTVPPNIVLVVLDTARADRVSYNGYDRMTTPNLDALTRDSVIYRNAHSTAPWTLPAHMSMFTGLLPGRHGATWRAFAEPAEMSLEEILSRPIAFSNSRLLLPEVLRRSGYTTLGISSNAWVSRRTGFDVGFDDFYESWQQSDRALKAFRWIPQRFRSWERLSSETRTLSEFATGDAGQVLSIFRQHLQERGQLREPFFLFFNLIDPHFPYSPPMSWRYAFSDDLGLGEAIARFDFHEMSLVAGARQIDVAEFSPFYDAELSYADFALGRLLTWLREKGYYDETQIVVTSDHGEHLGEEGHFSHQFSVAEELLQIPLVVKYPGSDQAGHVEESPLVSNLDVYQTILQAAGRTTPIGRPFGSLDLARMEDFDREHLIAEYYYSDPFLQAHEDLFEGFSQERNRTVRRVLFDLDSRYEFVEKNGQSEVLSAPERTDQNGVSAAIDVLNQYLETLGPGMLTETGDQVDEATLERLRSLGYLQ